MERFTDAVWKLRFALKDIGKTLDIKNASERRNRWMAYLCDEGLSMIFCEDAYKNVKPKYQRREKTVKVLDKIADILSCTFWIIASVISIIGTIVCEWKIWQIIIAVIVFPLILLLPASILVVVIEVISNIYKKISLHCLWRDFLRSLGVKFVTMHKIEKYVSKHKDEILALCDKNLPTYEPTTVKPITDPQLRVDDIKIGNVYTFGSYEQDNNTSNGNEPIEWKVLDKQGTSVLLISKYALDCKQYYHSFSDVTWEWSTPRWWLNEKFFYNAFSKQEQSIISTTLVTADINPKESRLVNGIAVDPGKDMLDKIFLLSIKEVEKYFQSDKDRKCVPTDFAIANGAVVDVVPEKYGKPGCYWWLRTPGFHGLITTSCVTNYGEIFYDGSVCNGNTYCVRPALWINLGS